MWRPTGDSVSNGCVTTDDFPILAVGESYRVTQGLVARWESRLALEKARAIGWAAQDCSSSRDAARDKGGLGLTARLTGLAAIEDWKLKRA